MLERISYSVAVENKKWPAVYYRILAVDRNNQIPDAKGRNSKRKIPKNQIPNSREGILHFLTSDIEHRTSSLGHLIFSISSRIISILHGIHSQPDP